jgi:hypothetical protein
VGAAVVELHGAADEAELAKGLGGVAQLPPGVGIPLLAEQPDVVAQSQQAFEQLYGLGAPARASTSQKEQARNTPSPPGNPSSVSSGR